MFCIFVVYFLGTAKGQVADGMMAFEIGNPTNPF